MSVMFLTLGENLGFYCADALSRFWIWDFMLENFEPGVMPSLKLIMQILKKADEECYDIVSQSGDIPTFSLSWFLTWFSHVINDLGVV